MLLSKLFPPDGTALILFLVWLDNGVRPSINHALVMPGYRTHFRIAQSVPPPIPNSTFTIFSCDRAIIRLNLRYGEKKLVMLQAPLVVS
jgi:hypothetical protein